MRLLILTPEFSEFGGGIGTFYSALSEFLPETDLRIIEGSAYRTSTTKDLRTIAGARIETLESARVADYWERFGALAQTPILRRHLAAAWAIWEQADFGDDADVVEAADWGLLFAPPALAADKPFVVQGHGSIGQISVHDPIAGEETHGALVRLMERSLLTGCPFIQTLSRSNAAFWQSETKRPVQMIRPAWTGVADHGGAQPSSDGLVVGRLQRWKGPDVLCEALRCLGTGAPVIDWVGRDTAWGDVHSTTSQHLSHDFPDIWGDRLVWRQPEPPAQIAARQAGALFNLVPSTWDVFNFTAVEAMASGRPTIVSTGAGASELVVDGENGFLFENGNAEALAAAIDKVCSLPAGRLAEIGRAAQETLKRELDPQMIARQRIDAYAAAIEAHRSGAYEPITGWLADAVRPAATPSRGDAAHLNAVPIRTLATHLAERLRRKAAGAFTRAP
jgi:glycosyltransferase involved in cell wall biosynthesis